MARQLIERKTAPFDAAAYKDHYATALKELLDAKLSNRSARRVSTGAEPAEPGAENVIDLMAALKASLDKSGGKRTATKGSAKKPAAGSAAKAKPRAESTGTGTGIRIGVQIQVRVAQEGVLMAARDKLADYNAKRDFAKTREPRGDAGRARRGALSFLVQKHAARRLHYDLRLEWDGVLLSWAVTRGPSDDPSEKRLAVRTEDHPLSYGDFEGTIPQGEYGGGTVMMWDRGSWEPLHDPAEGLKAGMLHFSSTASA